MDARVPNEVKYPGSTWGRERAASHWDRPVDVSVENVVRTFGTTPALHGVSLEIESGELVALLGPSGSGKTTLLRILAGLDVPTFGRVLFDGEDALKLTVQQRNVGLVFQNYALFRHMNVLDNIGFGLRVRPWARRPSRKEIRKRALDLLDPAFAHHHHAVGKLERFLLVVSDEHGGVPRLVVQFQQPTAQIAAHLGVERAERLVEQKHARLDGERPGERHALALAA